MKIGCVVLAAGHARRFGSNKLLADLAGKPLLAHVLAALPRDQFARITAVACARPVADLCRESGVPCLTYGGGEQSDSVRLGVRAMRGMDGCLFVLGDQPLCTRASMERLAAAFRANPLFVYRLSFLGKPGSPVLFPRAYFPALESLQGDCGGMAALRGREEEVRLVEAGTAAELWDADTPESVRRMAAYCQKHRRDRR